MTSATWRLRLDAERSKDPQQLDDIDINNIICEAKSISSLSEFERWYKPYRNEAIFRGHEDSEWPLLTSLDRHLFKTIKTENKSSYGRQRKPHDEQQGLLDRFRPAAHNYLWATPAYDEIVDWLALMQHYGTPTCLLDWSRSPFVALYFSLKRADEARGGAVYAIDCPWLEARAISMLRQQDKIQPSEAKLRDYVDQRLLKSDNPPIIVPVQPKRQDSRMFAQQGQFLCSLAEIKFESALLTMLFQSPTPKRQVISKVRICSSSRAKLLKQLQAMNISEASLFPGLDGFARSIGIDLEIRMEAVMENQMRQMQRPQKPRMERKKN